MDLNIFWYLTVSVKITEIVLAIILFRLRLSYFGLQNSIVKIMSFNYFYKKKKKKNGYFGHFNKYCYNACMKYVTLYLTNFICYYYVKIIIGLRNQK